MGLRYGCPVEDVITGLSIQCLGWKSVYYKRLLRGCFNIAGYYYLGTVPHGMDSERLVLAFKWDTVHTVFGLQTPWQRYSTLWSLPFTSSEVSPCFRRSQARGLFHLHT